MNKRNIIFSIFIICSLSLPLSVTFATKPSIVENQSFVVMPTMIQNPPPVFLEATMQPIGKSGSTMLTWTDLPCAFIGERINGMGIYNGHTLLGSEMEVVASHGVIILSDAVVDDKMGDLTIVLGVKHWTILSGTEDLVGIHGCGTTEEIGVGTYQIEGQIHFD